MMGNPVLIKPPPGRFFVNRWWRVRYLLRHTVPDSDKVHPTGRKVINVVLLLVHDDWEASGRMWRTPPWPTFAVGGEGLWPEEPVWITADVTGFLRRWQEERDPRKVELWVSGGNPGEEVCYFTSEEPKGLQTLTEVEEPEPWWVMRAVW